MNGGYKLIDLKGKDFTLNVPVTIHGIYDSIESAGTKPIIIGNYSIGGIDKQSKWVNFVVSGTNFVSVPGIDKDTNLLNIVIADDDTVTFKVN